MMKVAIFCATLPPYPCGVGKHAYFLASSLQAQDNDVTLVTLHGNNRHTPGQFRIDASLRKFGVLEYIRWARRNKSAYDVVHLQYPTKLNRRGVSVILLPWILRMYGYKTVLTLHELSEASVPGRIRNILLSLGFGRIILPNRRDAKYQSFLRRPIHHITLGPTLVRGQSKEIQLKSRSIGFLGFMDGSKGEEDLLRATKLIKTPATVYFLTSFLPNKNEYHNRLQRLVSDLGISNMVEWACPSDDQEILDYLHAIDIVVMPFRQGVTRRNSTLLEAIVAAKPIIVSDSGQLPGYLIPENNCLVFAAGDIVGLAQSMEELLGDPKLQLRLSEGTRGIACQFDWQKIAEQTATVYVEN